MENDKLKQGNELQKLIEKAKSTLFYWKGANRLYDDTIHFHYSVLVVNEHNPDGYMTHNNRREPVSPETFTVVKALNVEYWQRELDWLQKEFDEL